MKFAPVPRELGWFCFSKKRSSPLLSDSRSLWRKAFGLIGWGVMRFRLRDAKIFLLKTQYLLRFEFEWS